MVDGAAQRPPGDPVHGRARDQKRLSALSDRPHPEAASSPIWRATAPAASTILSWRYLGGTSEHVPTAIEDGSFGMWEETGRWMNEAIQAGAARRLRIWLQALARVHGRTSGSFSAPGRLRALSGLLGTTCPRPTTSPWARTSSTSTPAWILPPSARASGVDFHKFCYSVSATGRRRIHELWLGRDRPGGVFEGAVHRPQPRPSHPRKSPPPTSTSSTWAISASPSATTTPTTTTARARTSSTGP